MKHLFTKFIVAPLGVATVSLAYLIRYPRPPLQGPPDADNEMFACPRKEQLAQLPITALLRSLFVHSFCTHPRLVDLGIQIMKSRYSNSLMDAVIRQTFFAHFCGGETREEAVDLGKRLQSEGIIPLLGYSKESSDSPADIQNTEAEIIRCIEAANSGRKPFFVAIKLSGLSPDKDLRRLEQDVQTLVSSSQIPETSAFLAQARQLLSRYPDLFNRLHRISGAARKHNVFLVLDAEIRFQGDVDALPTGAILCSLLNTDRGHIWNTHQMIFQDSLQKLDEWAGDNPVKLVRGAYFQREPPEKVARSKEEADNTYDSAVIELLTKRSNPILIATHNHRSVVKAFRLLRQHQATESRYPRMICFGQLYGMGDDITYGLVRELNNTTFSPSFNISVVKYIPYGDLNDVMPYLVRRAEENRGILKGSMMEREFLYAEVKRRIMRRLGFALDDQENNGG